MRRRDQELDRRARPRVMRILLVVEDFRAIGARLCDVRERFIWRAVALRYLKAYASIV